MEEKDVIPDGPLLLGFLLKNGGKDVMPDRTSLINLSKGQFGLQTNSLCFMMIATKQQACRSTSYSKHDDCGETANLQAYQFFKR